MMLSIPAARRPLLDPHVTAFLVFSLGFAAAILAGLAAENADYARAKYTIWPTVALGGTAVALMLRCGIERAIAETNWRVWWTWGLVAYVAHLYWGFGLVFEWDIATVYAAQGSFVASANFGLLILWGLSVLLAYAGLSAKWLHGITALVFAVSTLVASIVFGRDISPIGGGIILVVWIVALYLRKPD